MFHLIESIQKIQDALYKPKDKVSATIVELLEGVSTIFWNIDNWINVIKDDDHVSAFWDDLNANFCYCQSDRTQ